LRQTTFESSLARGGLALAGHQAVAKQHFTHYIRRDAGTFNSGSDSGAA
jgi:hypothetical protein